jgi:hypothetical protein
MAFEIIEAKPMWLKLMEIRNKTKVPIKTMRMRRVLPAGLVTATGQPLLCQHSPALLRSLIRGTV